MAQFFGKRCGKKVRHHLKNRPVLLIEIRIINVVVVREGSVVITAEMIQGRIAVCLWFHRYMLVYSLF